MSPVILRGILPARRAVVTTTATTAEVTAATAATAATISAEATTATTATAATGAAVFARARLVYVQVSTVELLAVELLYGFLAILVRRHLYEAKAARAAGFTVFNNVD